MEKFSIEIASGQTITGRHCLPHVNQSTFGKDITPLLVCLHGGSYDSEYFDAAAEYSWSKLNSSFGIPIVAIDRPCYGGSTELPHQHELGDAESPTPTQRQAEYINSRVLPHIWDKFGLQCGASSMVVLGHSVDAMVAVQIVAAYSTQKTSLYPLSGLIVSGIGCQSRHHQGPGGPQSRGPQSKDQTSQEGDETKAQEPAQSTEKKKFMNMERAQKDAKMLDYTADKSPADLLIDPAVLSLTERLNHPAPLAEVIDVAVLWRTYWHREAAKVNVPVLYALSEADPWFDSSDAAVAAFAAGLTGSPKVIQSRIAKAPHCTELSLHGRGWMLQCGGFALECAVTSKLNSKK